MPLQSDDDSFIQTFAHSPYQRRHHHHHPSMINEFYPRRNSYQLAIHTSKSESLQRSHHGTRPFSSASSSIVSIAEPAQTSRSLYTFDEFHCHSNTNPIQRSFSQPAVRSLDSDILLENATNLLDSPVHALRPAHHKSRTTLAPTHPVSTRSSLAALDSIADSNHDSNMSIIPMTSAYRIVIVRSFASIFALASLLSTEMLQTSTVNDRLSFRSLLTFHLAASIGALILAAHAARIHHTRYRWTISDVLAYDRCSQILIVVASLFTGAWVAMQCFQLNWRLLLISAALSGLSYSCMIIKTFEHFLQLSTSLPIPNVKKLTTRLNTFAFIYNALTHLSLALGGTCLFAIVLFQQYRLGYVLIVPQPCLLIPCVPLHQSSDDNTLSVRPLPQMIRVNLTMHINEKKQGKKHGTALSDDQLTSFRMAQRV
jgi:hypothetical protein